MGSCYGNSVVTKDLLCTPTCDSIYPYTSLYVRLCNSLHIFVVCYMLLDTSMPLLCPPCPLLCHPMFHLMFPTMQTMSPPVSPPVCPHARSYVPMSPHISTYVSYVPPKCPLFPLLSSLVCSLICSPCTLYYVPISPMSPLCTSFPFLCLICLVAF